MPRRDLPEHGAEFADELETLLKEVTAYLIDKPKISHHEQVNGPDFSWFMHNLKNE